LCRLDRNLRGATQFKHGQNMIFRLNHTKRDSAIATTNEVLTCLLTLLEEGHLTPADFARVQIQLDWLQYKQNFREAVLVVQNTGRSSGNEPIEIRIDSRQVTPGSLREALRKAMRPSTPDTNDVPDRVYLEDFKSFRSSIAWEFNRLYWQRLKDWEQVTGKGYEQALPGGQSDGHRPEAIADSVEDFWTLLKDLDTRNQLPLEVFALEIGVGMGTRVGLWLDRFRILDRERGTNYYPRLRFLLGDYSLSTLDRSRAAVQNHIDLCSFIALDALDPIKTLSFLRHKILYVHSTNTYDNLPDEEVVWRDGRIYWVEVRSYVPAADAAHIATACDFPVSDIPRTVKRLLEVGAEALPDRAKGMIFWMETWKALRREERLVNMVDLPDATFPAGLSIAHMEDFLKDAPNDLRFHLSSGALESFRNTLPLLHPRGFLHVQDIFVTDLDDYLMGFHGPGKMDGSIVNAVNGALLREVAERGGYDVHFTPFTYRPGSKTSVLRTTRRE
jgi:hypothetical protein